MKSIMTGRGLIRIMLAIVFMAPLLIPFRYAYAGTGATDTTLESMTLAEAAAAVRGNSPDNPEQKHELSDFSKYTIAVLVMLFFLGLAIFVQLRAEREK